MSDLGHFPPLRDAEDDVSGEGGLGQPRPSIYVRLMPLMYGLIGAASALLLNTLLCGSPFSPMVSRRCECRAQKAGRSAVEPVQRGAAVAAGAIRPSVDEAVGNDPDAVIAVSAADAGPSGDAPKSVAIPDAHRRETVAPQTRVAGEKVKAAIRPCVRRWARSFRVGVRAGLDGKVARVFVARDPGVNARMIGCIERRLAGVSLPLTVVRYGYVEWRVRQEEQGDLSLNVVRPRRLLQSP